jgi:hypothetical protein
MNLTRDRIAVFTRIITRSGGVAWIINNLRTEKTDNELMEEGFYR